MDDARLTCIGLASEGFAGGDPDAVAEMPVETVLDLADFAQFQKDYASTKAHLNARDKR